MKLTRLLLLFIGLVISQPLFAQVHDDEAREAKIAEARGVVLKWLKLVDEGKYEESYERTAPFFQSRITQDKWVEVIEIARQPYGNLKEERKPYQSIHTYELEGAPEGEYIIFQYVTKFEQQGAKETIIPMLVNGKWKVSGYYLKPREMR